MITDEVIKEIYKTFSKPPKDASSLNLKSHLATLEPHHKLRSDDFEVIVEDLEEFNPFRRFLIRRLHGAVEFDKWIAFVFPNHILFFSKVDTQMQVHFKPEEQKKSFLGRLFGRKKG